MRSGVQPTQSAIHLSMNSCGVKKRDVMQNKTRLNVDFQTALKGGQKRFDKIPTSNLGEIKPVSAAKITV